MFINLYNTINFIKGLLKVYFMFICECIFLAIQLLLITMFICNHMQVNASRIFRIEFFDMYSNQSLINYSNEENFKSIMI